MRLGKNDTTTTGKLCSLNFFAMLRRSRELTHIKHARQVHQEKSHLLIHAFSAFSACGKQKKQIPTSSTRTRTCQLPARAHRVRVFRSTG
jgi:hypothetical protein